MTFQRWLRLAHALCTPPGFDRPACNATVKSAESDWPAYGNDPGGMRHSALSQINRENVAKLKVAWVFHTGDISDGHDGRKRSGFETTPILVDGRLYLTTPFNRVIALDPTTGKQLWSYDPKIDQSLDYGDGLINRGAATWLDPSLTPGKACKRRIFEATLDARLIALDAMTGMPCPGFWRVWTGGFAKCSGLSTCQPGRTYAGLVSHDLASGNDRRYGDRRIGH
jgi:glucose dehydrogenase